MSRRRHGQSRPRRHQPTVHAIECPCGLPLAYSGTAGFYCLRCDIKVDHARH